MENTAPMNSPGSTPQTSIIRSTSSAVRLRVQTLMKPCSSFSSVLVGVEVERGDRQHEVLHPRRLERGVGQGEHAALADAEQVDLLGAGLAAHGADAVVEVAQHVVVDGQVAVGAAGVAPVDHPDVDAPA